MPFPTVISGCLAAVLAVTVPCHAGDGPADSPFPLRETVIVGNGTTGPYSLDARFIGGTATVSGTAPGGAATASSTVTVKSDTTAAVGARVDSLTVDSWNETAGTVTFSRPVTAGDTVRVRWGAPPDWLAADYTRTPGAGLTARPDNPATWRGAAERTPGVFPGLTFGGSKTFEVNVGDTRRAALNQTLRLNVSGKLTDDISLNAVISDQNLPITPEGNTRELSDLDRVLIELRGKRFSIDMGDTDLSHSRGRWLGYERRLSGANGVLRLGSAELFGSGAVSDGRHLSTVIPPIEGIQGPYRLAASDGRSDISVVPGTEQLWINGDRLDRGLDGDYVIDYETGEITFTERRIIGADMRIVADYEYMSESYRRTFYAGGGGANLWDGRIRVDVVAAREADDPDRPVLAAPAGDWKKALAAAGNGAATLSGIRPAAGDSSGWYDLADGHLVYNPRGDGAYNATFSWVGEDAGIYRYLGGGIYEFVPEEARGPGSGASYDAVTILPGPVSHSLAGGTVTISPLPGLTLEGEAAGSSVDRNTLSSLDDGDNNGGAWRAGVSYAPTVTAGVPLTLTFAGRHRSRDERFSPLDRDRPVEENRDWGLPLVMEDMSERITELETAAELASGRFAGTGFGIAGGSAALGADASSDQRGVHGRVAVANRGDVRARFDRIERAGVVGLPDETIRRLNAGAGLDLASWRADLRYEREEAEGDGTPSGGTPHGAAYDDIRTEVRGPLAKGVILAGDWLYRAERARRTAWGDSALVRGGGLELDTGAVRARYSRRERTVAGGQDLTTDQALVEGGWRPTDGFLQVDLSYRAGRSRETTRRRNYIFAGDNQGAWRWEDYNGDGVRDPDEFVPDPHGGYMVFEEILDAARPVNTVRAYSRLGLTMPRSIAARLAPGLAHYAGLSGLGDLASETSVEINEKSAAPAGDVFLLRLDRFRKEGFTAAGDARLQQDLTLPLGGDGSARVRIYRFASLDAEYVTGTERRSDGEESLRLRVPLAADWSGEWNLAASRASRTMAGRPAGDYRVRSIATDATLSWNPEATMTINIGIGGGSDRDSVSDSRARYLTATPSLAWHFSGKGRFTVSWTTTAVQFDDPPERIPWTMAKGRQPGTNHDIDIALDYRISNRINLVASYTGRRFAGREYEQFARTQLRALF